MTPDPELLTTTEAARVLGVTRANVGYLIRAERLPAVRVGSRLYLPRAIVQTFSATYVPHVSSGRRSAGSPQTVWDALQVIAEVGECTTAELGVALDRHEGNARKYVLILRRRGFVESTPTGHRITTAGRAHLAKETPLAS